MRPLQLPICFRRLFGAALAELVGPAVKPHVSADRAARAGGSCGPNICCAYRNLEAELPEGGGTGALWQDMLGIHRSTMDEYVERHLEEIARRSIGTPADGTLIREAAILFAEGRPSKGSPFAGSAKYWPDGASLIGYSGASWP